jgi:hypothetical protein
MKTIGAVLAVVAFPALSVIDAHPTAAEVNRPWCTSDPRGTTNCGFTSYQQCQMTAGPGSGFYCEQNPWYLWYGAGGQRPDTTGRRERTRPY